METSDLQILKKENCTMKIRFKKSELISVYRGDIGILNHRQTAEVERDVGKMLMKSFPQNFEEVKEKKKKAVRKPPKNRAIESGDVRTK